MKELDPQHLFYDSPYPVKLDDGDFAPTMKSDNNKPDSNMIIMRIVWLAAAALLAATSAQAQVRLSCTPPRRSRHAR